MPSRTDQLIDSKVPAGWVNNGFDAAAQTYDTIFTNTHLGRLIRASVRRDLLDFSGQTQVLELGCGTGEDAVWLAQRGHEVTALDASTQMLLATQTRAEAAGVSVETIQCDLRRPQHALRKRVFGAAFSNFGPLNCVEDRRQLGAWLAHRLKPGAPFVAVVMGPLCPWEWLWHGRRGDWAAATRRLRGRVQAHAGGGGHLDVWYPSARTLSHELSPWFSHVHTRGVGVLLPPSEVAHVVERSARLFSALAKVEGVLGSSLPGRWLNDHYLLLLRRRDTLGA